MLVEVDQPRQQRRRRGADDAERADQDQADREAGQRVDDHNPQRDALSPTGQQHVAEDDRERPKDQRPDQDAQRRGGGRELLAVEQRERRVGQEEQADRGRQGGREQQSDQLLGDRPQALIAGAEAPAHGRD